MSISSVVSEGFGSFGTVALVITSGFGTGATPPAPPPAPIEQPISNWQAHRHPRSYRTREEQEEATKQERIRLGIIPEEYDARAPLNAPELVNPPAPEQRQDRAEAPLLPHEIDALKAEARKAAKAELDEYRRLLLRAQEEQDIAFVAAILAAHDDD